MAKNYSVVEALEILAGKDMKAKIDVITRYPLFSVAKPEDIIRALPEEITAKKVEGMLRGNVEVDKYGEEEIINDTTEVEAKVKKAVKEVIEGEGETKKRKRRTKAEIEAEKAKVKSEPEIEDDEFDNWDSEKIETTKKLKSKKKVEEEDDWGESESEIEDNWDDEEIEEKPKTKTTKKKATKAIEEDDEDEEEPWNDVIEENESNDEDDEWDF